jgi:hypothetical protein
MQQPLSARNVIITLCLGIPVIAFIINTLVIGGYPPINYFRDNIIIRAYPLASIASVLVMIKVYIVNWMRAAISRVRIVAWAITFVVVCAVALAYGVGSELYDEIIFVAVTVPMEMRYLIVAFSITSLMATYLKPRSIPHTIMIITQILVFCALSPLGEMIWPGLTEAGNWLHDVPQVGAYIALWGGNYIGMMILCVLLVLGMERLRAA